MKGIKSGIKITEKVPDIKITEKENPEKDVKTKNKTKDNVKEFIKLFNTNKPEKFN
jgi:hypothetical protein